LKSQYHKAWLAILLAAEILGAQAAFGTSVQFNFGPIATPSVTAVFQDIGPGQVQLTINALALPANNFIDSLYFSLNPVFDSKNLIFIKTDTLGGVNGTVNTANDSFKVRGGSGKFDIDLVFDHTSAFITGHTVTFSISGIIGLSANDFLFQETPTAGHLPNYAAGSVQDLSGIVVVEATIQDAAGVPDVASTFGLFLLGLFTLGFWNRRVRASERA
jgi:hypothetical protein